MLSEKKNQSSRPRKEEGKKMQGRVAEAVRRSTWALCSARRFSSGTRSRTADPAIHSGELEAGPDVHKGHAQGTTTNDTASDADFAETDDHIYGVEEGVFTSPKSPCQPSSKLKSSGVNQPLDPSIQQKRKQGSMNFQDVNCAGIDGTPWPEDKNKRTEDNREYYKHHKASPLSELEFVDSRKPISRASDKTADSGTAGNVIGWLPEQLETAEETLMRAAEMWRQNAMRGDPDAPHSRILRALRGENF
ncbi:hypothetical protein VNO77_18076 [Canavalia gladiata]|uniref:Uncharacterized protein n=1 Tax=Canavalia gladiata TaxID=3824 RepID=A0AAN9LK61_CANGL